MKRGQGEGVRDNNNNEEGFKKKKIGQKYRTEYKLSWSFLGPSLKGDEFVHCQVCGSDFSCAHGGRFDCQRHIKTKSHQDYEIISKENSNVKTFFTENSNSVLRHQRNVTKAELMLCSVVAQMNLSLSSSPVLVEMMKKMFPDSKIAQELTCGRGKTTEFMKQLSLVKQEDLTKRMSRGPFIISTDGSTDEKSKQYPMVVRTLCDGKGAVESELLSAPICTGSATGQNIFKLLDAELTKRNIPWSNCLALGCDNANVMTGAKKGVFAFVKEKQSEIFLAGCTLHLVHIGAKKAASVLPSVDDVLIDIYYYFNKSEKRQSSFKGIQELCSLDQKRMLKHVCTRWLSISRCIERLLYNWTALKSFFKEEKDSQNKQGKKKDTDKKTDEKVSKDTHEEPSYAQKKVDSIYKFISSPTNRLYVLFLHYTVKVFDEVLLGLQSEEPKIHVLRRMLHKLLRNIMLRFVKPSALKFKSVDKVSYKLSYNIKSNNELLIGEECLKFIEEGNHLRKEKMDEFYKNVVLYFTTLCDYLIAKLPLNDPLLIAAEVADVDLQSSSKVADVNFFLNRFPCLLPPGVSRDTIVEQFTDCQSTDVTGCISDSIDKTWWAIGNTKDSDGSQKLKELSLFMCGILTIQHSSAHCERVFSCVRKNRTDQRSALADSTLEAILVVKSTHGGEDFSDKILDHIKGSYYRSLKK